MGLQSEALLFFAMYIFNGIKWCLVSEMERTSGRLQLGMAIRQIKNIFALLCMYVCIRCLRKWVGIFDKMRSVELNETFIFFMFSSFFFASIESFWRVTQLYSLTI